MLKLIFIALNQVVPSLKCIYCKVKLSSATHKEVSKFLVTQIRQIQTWSVACFFISYFWLEHKIQVRKTSRYYFFVLIESNCFFIIQVWILFAYKKN